jgi:hypothetical protein
MKFTAIFCTYLGLKVSIMPRYVDYLMLCTGYTQDTLTFIKCTLLDRMIEPQRKAYQ